MKLAAVHLARVLGFVDVMDLNPMGKVFFPNVVKALITEFNFQKFPQRFEDLDQQKGIEFLAGEWRGITVDRLAIYDSGILLDTRSSTDDSERILQECLSWASKKLALEFSPHMIRRKGYVSNLAFYSDVHILETLNEALSKLSSGIGKAVGEIWNEELNYQPTAIWIQPDVVLRKSQLAGFTISRRAETPFAENKYWSEAPLPTGVHFALLEAFERDLSKGPPGDELAVQPTRKRRIELPTKG